MDNLSALQKAIRDIPDFPKKGILFKDITPLLKDPGLFSLALDLMIKDLPSGIDHVAAIEARGFIFGGALAQKLNCGFIPIRKPGKLPYKTYRQEYSLEYGTDALEIHQDALSDGQRVFLFDDLLATGGTALAGAKLLESCGGRIVQIGFLIELEFLKGIEKLADYHVRSLIKY